MLPAFTPAVARALEAANRYTVARGAAEVVPLDLLHALLEEDEGRAMTLCREAGLDPERYQTARGPIPESPPAAPLSRSRAVQQALDQARDLGGEMAGERTASSESLLLALVRGRPEVVALLSGLGLKVAHVESGLQVQTFPAPQLDEALHLADVTERVDVARIVDAAGNRAREALRVAEDYTRFVLDDAFLSSQLKTLRHDLTAALEELAGRELIEARETLRDVGTAIRTGSDHERDSLLDVVRANSKRLQEGLRSLEEFAKLSKPPIAERLEQMRYRAYTLERALAIGAEARRLLAGARLYVLLTGATCTAALDWTIAEAAEGGVDIVQLREKNLADRELIQRARRVRQWTRRAGVLFIVNDRPDIARLAEADGVHLGQDDLPVKEARRIMGPGALIGVSTHTLEQVRQAVLDAASYIGVGPTFPSATKQFESLAGLDFVRAAMAETTLPAFALGGIGPENVAEVVAAGARRIAVSAAIATADEPRQAALVLRAALG